KIEPTAITRPTHRGHLIAQRALDYITVVGIYAVTEAAQDRYRPARADARDGQRDEEGVGRFLRHERELGERFGAFLQRPSEEVRIAVRRWNDDPAHGRHAGAARLRREYAEYATGARPARDAAAVERIDIGCEGADEIVIE